MSRITLPLLQPMRSGASLGESVLPLYTGCQREFVAAVADGTLGTIVSKLD